MWIIVVEEEEMKEPKIWLVSQRLGAYSVLVIHNLDFRLDMILLVLPPGRFHTFLALILLNPPTLVLVSLGLSLKLFLKEPFFPLFTTWFLPHLTSVMFFEIFSEISLYFLPLLITNLSKLNF